MFERDWKTWCLVAVVAIGGLFEIIKHIPTSDSDLWRPENFRLANVLPYSLHDIPNMKPAQAHKPKAPHMLANPFAGHGLSEAIKQFVASNTPTETEFDKDQGKVEGKTVDKKDAKKDEDEWEHYIDPVTGKKMKRRKKKADDKKQEVAAQPQTPTPSQTPPSAGSGDNQDIPAAVSAAVANPNDDNTPIAPAPSGGSGSTAFNTLQEWEDRLMRTPSMSETLIFIQQYKDHLVSTEVFYGIVHDMLNDSRADMKSLGILCAAKTPSVESFEVLAALDKSEPSGNTLRTQADTALNQYVSLADLSVLKAVLTSGDAYSQTLAAQKVDTAAHQFLTSGSTTGGPSAQATNSANAAQFSGFLPVLSTLAHSSNSSLSAQASSTLTDLQSMLGTSATSVASAQNLLYEEEVR
jgi:hypothetical protein